MTTRFFGSLALAILLPLLSPIPVHAQELRLIRVRSGPSGKVAGSDFVFDEVRSRFVYPNDNALTVYFEWDAAPGDHVLTATWTQPDGRVASISPDVKIQTATKDLHCYWIFSISADLLPGTWTVDVRVDGRPAGSYVFEIAGVDGPPVRFTLDQAFKTYSPSVVRVHRLDDAGRRIDSSSGFVIGSNVVATAFQSIDASASVEVEFADGRRVSARSVLALSRPGDWALLRVDTGQVAPIPIGDGTAVPIGARLATFDMDAGSRVILPIDVSAMSRAADYGARLQFVPEISPDAVGGPLIDERGRAVAIVGGSLMPGSRIDARAAKTSPWLYARRRGGNAATTLPDAHIDAAAEGKPMAALGADGVLTPPLAPMQELVLAGTSTQIPKDAASFVPRETAEFSSAGGDVVNVYMYWAKVGKLSKGEISASVLDVSNQLRVRVPAKKVSLRTEQQLFSFTFPTSGFPVGYYRVDVQWNGQAVWRTYVHVVD
jgi:hypothetical protein